MSYDAERLRMVSEQLSAREIRDRRVLAAMARVPRHCFVSSAHQHVAYDDHPLPIGHGQTISQPYMVALMSELLQVRGGERILEIGTGSGYQAAVLAELGAEVYSVERLDQLAAQAETRLHQLGYGARVHVRLGDGAEGWPEAAPFAAIIVTAAAHRVPRALLPQLAERGTLLLPLGEVELQGLVRLRRGRSGWEEDYYGECRFVKLVGVDGWDDG